MGAFRKLGIAAKIYASVGILAVVAAIVCALAQQTMGAYNAKVSELNNLSDRALLADKINGLILAVVMDSRGVYMARDAAELEKFAKPLLANLKVMEQRLTEVERITPGSDRDSLTKVLAKAREFVTFRTAMVETGRQQGSAGAREVGDNDANRSNRQQLNNEMEALVDFNDKKMAVLTSGIDSFYANRLAILVAVSAGGVVVGLALAIWVVAGSVTRPIVRLTQRMLALAEGDTANPVLAADRTDEIGQMARAVVVFRDKLIKVAMLESERAEENEAKERRRQVVDRMVSDFTLEIDRVTGLLTRSSSSLKTAAEAMSETANATANRSTAVAAGGEEASRNVQTVAAAVEELSASTREISERVQETAGTAGKATDEVRRTKVCIGGLRQAAERIGEVVKLIADISSKTNLLALNATIEAARAGEAGKGFAVVASEVKALATQTARATEEIAQQVASIQSATVEAETSIGGVFGTIERVSGISTTIASAVEEQGAATQEIARNVQQAAAGTGEVSANIAEVAKATDLTRASASSVFDAAAGLGEQSASLRQHVEAFVAELKAA
jgi:methyl-accepting chemotaxis protein